MEDWKSAIIEVLEEIDRDANLTKDIYPLFQKKYGKSLPRTWKATIRNCLEKNSSDSDAWNGTSDIFKLESKGSGVWSIKSSSEAKKKERILKDYEQIVLDKKPKFEELIALDVRKNNSIPKFKSTNLDLPPGKRFERGVWQLFFRMGARVYNNDKELKFDLRNISKSDKPSQQIDNLFIMRDKYVFFVECKESLSKGGVSARGLVNQNRSKWKNLKKPLEKRFRQMFKNMPGFKIMHVIATNGFNWSDEDIQRIEDDGFILLRQEEIEYFQGCYTNSGSGWFTFNQFLATFRKGKDDYHNKKHEGVMAFRTRRDFNEIFDESDKNNFSYAYTSSMKVKDLLRISSVSHHSALKIHNIGNEIKSSYQRILKKTRLNLKTGIPAFISKTNKPFINNLLINYKGDIPLNKQFDPKETWGQGRGGLLKFHSLSPGMFHLIDGQHRLFGYSPLFEEDEDCEFGNHELIITIFDNLSAEEESKLFLHINNEQVGIAKSLIIEIEQLAGVHASNKKQQLQNLSKSIVDYFLVDKESPFLEPKAIKGVQKGTDVYGDAILEGALTPGGVMENMKSSPLLSQYDNDFRTGLGFKKGTDITDEYVNTIRNLKDIYIDYFSQIRDANDDLWVKQDSKGRTISNNNEIASNIPIGGLLMLLDKLVDEGIKKNKSKEIIKIIQPQLHRLLDGLKNISEADRKDLFNSGSYGGGAPRQFYHLLLEKFYPNLVSKSLQDEIDKRKKVHNQKGNLQENILYRENLELKKQLESQKVAIQFLAFRKMFANNFDPFFKKLFGDEYWEKIFAKIIDKKIESVRADAYERYKFRHNELATDETASQQLKEIDAKPMILWVEWSQWKSILSHIFLKSLNSDYFEEKLTAEFRNSEEFKKYDKKISEVIRNIFFIAKNKKNNDPNNTLKWMQTLPKLRGIEMHADDFTKLTPKEQKEYNEIKENIYDVVRSLADFVVNKS
jgi:DGQHR domain-containing protein